MTSSIESVVYLGLAALLWGATNPLIKKGSEGLQYVKASSPCRQLAKEVVFLVTTLKVASYKIQAFSMFKKSCNFGTLLYFIVFNSWETDNLISFIFVIAVYIIPFVINQCGSVLYFIALQSADLSLAVPVSNSLTFVFTAISGWFLGEEKSDRNTYIGMVLISVGITLCCIDKLDASVQQLK